MSSLLSFFLSFTQTSPSLPCELLATTAGPSEVTTTTLHATSEKMTGTTKTAVASAPPYSTSYIAEMVSLFLSNRRIHPSPLPLAQGDSPCPISISYSTSDSRRVRAYGEVGIEAFNYWCSQSLKVHRLTTTYVSVIYNWRVRCMYCRMIYHLVAPHRSFWYILVRDKRMPQRLE